MKNGGLRATLTVNTDGYVTLSKAVRVAPLPSNEALHDSWSSARVCGRMAAWLNRLTIEDFSTPTVSLEHFGYTIHRTTTAESLHAWLSSRRKLGP